MSEGTSGVVTGAVGESAVEAGALLRQAREAINLRIEVLAASLKVPVVKLEALEAGQLEAMSDRVFVRALAASVCRHVKLDPAVVLSRLPATSQSPWADSQTGINTPVRQTQGRQRRSWPEYLSRPVVLAVLALLVGAALISFWPQLRAAGVLSSGVPEADGGVQGEKIEAVVPVNAPEPSAPLAPSVPPAPPAPPVSPVVPLAAAPVAVVPEPVVAPAAADSLLVLRARGESWVRVVDAKNVVALQKLMVAGETANVTGLLPLAVTVGRADMVDAQVRGQPMDLSALSSSNVARFSVK